MRKFDLRFKLKVVRDYLAGKGGYKILAAKYGIANSLVRSWVAAYQHHGSAVRLVQEHRGEYPSQWAAVQSIAPKIGCSGHTLLKWVQLQEVEAGTRPGVPQAEQERIKALEREVKELRRANEILKSASAFFAQAALDRELKK